MSVHTRQVPVKLLLILKSKIILFKKLSTDRYVSMSVLKGQVPVQRLLVLMSNIILFMALSVD
jgi:hypothetical protein